MQTTKPIWVIQKSKDEEEFVNKKRMNYEALEEACLFEKEADAEAAVRMAATEIPEVIRKGKLIVELDEITES